MRRQGADVAVADVLWAADLVAGGFDLSGQVKSGQYVQMVILAGFGCPPRELWAILGGGHRGGSAESLVSKGSWVGFHCGGTGNRATGPPIRGCGGAEGSQDDRDPERSSDGRRGWRPARLAALRSLSPLAGRPCRSWWHGCGLPCARKPSRNRSCSGIRPSARTTAESPLARGSVKLGGHWSSSRPACSPLARDAWRPTRPCCGWHGAGRSRLHRPEAAKVRARRRETARRKPGDDTGQPCLHPQRARRRLPARTRPRAPRSGKRRSAGARAGRGPPRHGPSWLATHPAETGIDTNDRSAHSFQRMPSNPRQSALVRSS